MASTVTQPEKLKKVANEAIDAVEEKTLEGMEGVRSAAMNASERAHEMEAELNKAVAEVSGKVSRYVQEKPLQAAGIAFAAGMLATMILRKR